MLMSGGATYAAPFGRGEDEKWGLDRDWRDPGDGAVVVSN